MQRVIQSVLGTRSATEPAETRVGDSMADRGEREDWYKQYGLRHMAIIPDGNRRWANERSLPANVGHSTGLLKVLASLVRELSQRGVHTMTAWGFSTENWKRQQSEIDHLMNIFAEFFENRMMKLALEYDARVIHLGRKDRLPKSLIDLLHSVESKTAHHKSHVYNVALDYGGEDELMRAAQRMADALVSSPDASRNIRDYLDTAGQPYPNPDLLVRPSGETRMSGFMPIQTAYSELFFIDRHFPEVDLPLMYEIVEAFAQRKRRFGQ